MFNPGQYYCRVGEKLDLNGLQDRKECGGFRHAPQLPYRWSLSIVGYKDLTPFRNALICLPAYYTSSSILGHLLHRLSRSLHVTLCASLFPPHPAHQFLFSRKLLAICLPSFPHLSPPFSFLFLGYRRRKNLNCTLVDFNLWNAPPGTYTSVAR
jgi:hypothetical protein